MRAPVPRLTKAVPSLLTWLNRFGKKRVISREGDCFFFKSKEGAGPNIKKGGREGCFFKAGKHSLPRE